MELHQDPPARLTTALVGQRAGLKDRAVQIHGLHLFQRGLVDVDRRTPLPGAALDCRPTRPRPAATALEWARSIKAPDRACTKLLHAYAGQGWRGQLNDARLAELAGMSVRSVERHRPHLGDNGAKLIRFTREQWNPNVDNGPRLPDRYALFPGLAVVEMPKLDKPARDTAWFDAAAEMLLKELTWFRSRPAETPEQWAKTWNRGLRILAKAYRDHAERGWEAPDWRAHLHRNTLVDRPLFHLSRLIDEMADRRPPVSGSAEVLATGLRPHLGGVCADPYCRAPMPATRTDELCGGCRAKTRKAV